MLPFKIVFLLIHFVNLSFLMDILIPVLIISGKTYLFPSLCLTFKGKLRAFQKFSCQIAIYSCPSHMNINPGSNWRDTWGKHLSMNQGKTAHFLEIIRF